LFLYTHYLVEKEGLSFKSQRKMASESSTTSWTWKQNKDFENVLAIYDKDTPNCWEKVAAMVENKSRGEVKYHHDILLQDIELIEANLVPTANYKSPAKGFGPGGNEKKGKC